jgi:SAM-dependent methyltransferase
VTTWDAAEYGETWAEVYDRLHADRPDTATAVDTLAALAGGGPILELGVGTGRLALPLAARGLHVVGIDASVAMLDRLTAKPGADRVTTVRGDFSSFDLGRRFRLVLVAFNTLFNLPSQGAQVDCFSSAARHLEPGGAFVVEAFVPDPRRHGDDTVRAPHVVDGTAVLVVTRHDPLTQQLLSARVLIEDGTIRMLPVKIRYAWPSELDLMAKMAGLEVSERWGAWDRRPFTAESTGHVTVYRSSQTR